MPKITALVHADDEDVPRLARTLDSLRSCDDLLIVDHSDGDDIRKIAQKHGGRVRKGIPGVEPGAYQIDAFHPWVLVIHATEAVNEALEAALFEWKEGDHEYSRGFACAIREESGEGWRELPAELRLINRTCIHWMSEIPPPEPGMPVLDGFILRFRTP